MSIICYDINYYAPYLQIPAKKQWIHHFGIDFSFKNNFESKNKELESKLLGICCNLQFDSIEHLNNKTLNDYFIVLFKS